MSDLDADETTASDAETSPGDVRAARGWTPGSVLLVGALFTLTAAVLVAAWVSDDALITLRTVDHFLHGRGLRFNPVERVQSFTHPLWLFVVAPFMAVTGEGLWAPIAASLVCTAGAVAIAVRLCGPPGAGSWACVLVLAASKSFVDYSTSGLENPLTHLLLAAFAFVWLGATDGGDGRGERDEHSRRRVFQLTLLTALVFTNRMDAVLLVAPAALWLGLGVLRSGRLGRALPAVLAGLAPALLWIAFAWLYYGSPWPNTAFSKLSTGIERGPLVAQGLVYLRVFLELDAPGALALLAALVAGFASGRTELRALVAGVPLYAAYVVWIGGDFMAGRFFATPVFVAAIVLGRSAREARPLWQARFGPAISVAAVALAAFSPGSPLRASTADTYEGVDSSGQMPTHGVVDERLWYYTRSGALSAYREDGLEPGAACKGEPRVLVRRVCGGLGRIAFEGCADDHWIDPCGLSDAFLARRPIPENATWRIGHFMRAVPEGYGQSVAEGRGVMREPELNVEFDRVMLRVRGPVFGGERLREILMHPFDWAD